MSNTHNMDNSAKIKIESLLKSKSVYWTIKSSASQKYKVRRNLEVP